LGVDWKKKIPIYRREIPLALGAIAFSALSDFLLIEHIWGKH